MELLASIASTGLSGVHKASAYRSTWEIWQHCLNIPLSFVQTKRVSSGLARLDELSLVSGYLIYGNYFG
ncbi:MAG: hypothetical protein WA110_02870 [Anaerolineaceae bacterium]